MLADIPEDLSSEILSQLSTRDHMRLMVVSKSWCKLVKAYSTSFDLTTDENICPYGTFYTWSQHLSFGSREDPCLATQFVPSLHKAFWPDSWILADFIQLTSLFLSGKPYSSRSFSLTRDYVEQLSRLRFLRELELSYSMYEEEKEIQGYSSVNFDPVQVLVESFNCFPELEHLSVVLCSTPGFTVKFRLEGLTRLTSLAIVGDVALQADHLIGTVFTQLRSMNFTCRLTFSHDANRQVASAPNLTALALSLKDSHNYAVGLAGLEQLARLTIILQSEAYFPLNLTSGLTRLEMVTDSKNLEDFLYANGHLERLQSVRMSTMWLKSSEDTLEYLSCRCLSRVETLSIQFFIWSFDGNGFTANKLPSMTNLKHLHIILPRRDLLLDIVGSLQHLPKLESLQVQHKESDTEGWGDGLRIVDIRCSAPYAFGKSTANAASLMLRAQHIVPVHICCDSKLWRWDSRDELSWSASCFDVDSADFWWRWKARAMEQWLLAIQEAARKSTLDAQLGRGQAERKHIHLHAQNQYECHDCDEEAGSAVTISGVNFNALDIGFPILMGDTHTLARQECRRFNTTLGTPGHDSSETEFFVEIKYSEVAADSFP